MTATDDDKKRPGVAKAPTDSESVGLSTVPRRRIVVGSDPQAGSSNPPAEAAPSRRQSGALSEGGGREKRSSAPAHLRSKREKLAGTGYSETPANGEERVAPSAIPRAPRVPKIESEKGEMYPDPTGGRTVVGVLGVGSQRPDAERADGAAASAEGTSSAVNGEAPPDDAQPSMPRRSDTARSVARPAMGESAPADRGAGSSDAPGSGTTAVGLPGARLPRTSDAPPPIDSASRFGQFGPATDGNFPPAYSPSGTLQSMSAVQPEVGVLGASPGGSSAGSPAFPDPGKFKSTLTGAGYLATHSRDLLNQAEKNSPAQGSPAQGSSAQGSSAQGGPAQGAPSMRSEERKSSSPPEAVRFNPERTIVGMGLGSGAPSPPVKPLRPSPPPVVLSDARAESLLVAIAEAAQGQLHESEMPIPSERLDAAVLQQLGQLDEALKSSPRVPAFERPASDHPSRPGVNFPPSDRFDESYRRLESSPSSSIDAPSPGSVPSQSALPGEYPTVGPTGLPSVGRYEVLARLKSGGMGSVYMCRLSGNAGFRRLFAMKVLHAHLTRDAEALESFQREARVLACVHHPNIVGVVDFGSEREPYIVLEYVEGGSLHELIRATTGGRDPRLVLTIVLDVLEGLVAAHAAPDEDGNPLGLVHCDVCPQNILVGVDGTARITDFGIAQTHESRLHPEQLRGKPRYLAPERTTSGAVDARVDLFSLGVVLYTALTGVEPFAGETAEETRWNVANKAVPTPSTVGFRPPPALDWLCLKALAKDPAGRFQSAEEMASQLRRIGEREGLLAPRNEVSEWVRLTLAPSLAARRVASRRGTVTGGGRLGTGTPPAVEPVDPHAARLPSRAPAPPPSAAEATAPLSNASGDAENTEVISADGTRRKRSKRVLYGTVALCFGILLWGMLAPRSLAKLFAIEDADVNGLEASSGPSEEAPAGAVVPELGPSFEDSGTEPEDPTHE